MNISLVFRFLLASLLWGIWFYQLRTAKLIYGLGSVWTTEKRETGFVQLSSCGARARQFHFRRGSSGSKIVRHLLALTGPVESLICHFSGIRVCRDVVCRTCAECLPS